MAEDGDAELTLPDAEVEDDAVCSRSTYPNKQKMIVIM